MLLETMRRRAALPGGRPSEPGTAMPAERHAGSEDRGRVIWLRPGPGRGAGPGRAALERGPVEGLSKYVAAGEPDDYRRRMVNNALALLVLTVLVVTGLWLADRMAAVRQAQDCVLSGRRACAPLPVAPLNRY